ncbi:NnrS family protein [Phenylobacterium soli]|uniref:NnrS family protein n=1 Tax=Phenylobacterium soli TaxID=2170551 RepID=A0A328AKU1_9CAUL|nr:NnrS family protein [Phenylobacterium soli]RAK55157.1 NnrS family protein [Phenylobacterium soli]
MSTAARRRAYSGPALFSFGFRPFFLFGAAWAALVVPLWLAVFMHGGPPEISRDWHIHEMLFGYLAAVIAGFLTTAVPNWTGRMPVIGAPLGVLVALWVAGRLAMLFPSPVSYAIDSLFLIAFAAVVWREVLAGRNWRNLPVCILVSLFALANVAFHFGPAGSLAIGVRVGLAAVAVLIALIGGRITPSFTRNWLNARGETRLPATAGRFDQVALGVTGVAAAAWAIFPDLSISGAALALAGLANLARLARWRGWLAWKEPLVTVLHLGYGWLGAGLLLLGLSALTGEVPRTAGVHALTAGAVGVMTLAVMTRASRGHTGRPLTADRATQAIFLLVNLAAVSRVAAPFLPTMQVGLLSLSAALWTLAFASFAGAYGKMLLTPRPARA